MENEGILPNNFLLRNRYEIVRYLGGKEISNHYIAKDCLKNKYWIIKEFISIFTSEEERAEAIQQIEFEANLLLELEHPQLPKVEDYFVANNKHYLVMEYIEGDELETIITENPEFPNEVRVIDWGRKICRVLNYLHSRTPNPVIFRALSPDNIMVTDDDDVKLIDFGISKIFQPKVKTLAIAKSINPHFSPLEQYSTLSTDARSDIYSLGATLYFAISKSLPLDAIDRTIGKITLQPPKNFNRSMTKEFSDIIMKAMATKKSDRYQTIREMKDDLDKVYKSQSTADTTDKNEKELPPEKGEEALHIEEERDKEPSHPVTGTSKVTNLLKEEKKKSQFIYLIFLCVIIVITVIFFAVYHIPGSISKFYLISRLSSQEDFNKFMALLNSKGQNPKFEIIKSPDVVIKKGYVITAGVTSFEKAEEMEKILLKKGLKYEIVSPQKENIILILSQEEFDDKLQAENTLASLRTEGLEELKIDNYQMFIREKQFYEVKVLADNDQERKELEKLLISNGYDFDLKAVQSSK